MASTGASIREAGGAMAAAPSVPLSKASRPRPSFDFFSAFIEGPSSVAHVLWAGSSAAILPGAHPVEQWDLRNPGACSARNDRVVLARAANPGGKGGRGACSARNDRGKFY